MIYDVKPPQCQEATGQPHDAHLILAAKFMPQAVPRLASNMLGPSWRMSRHSDQGQGMRTMGEAGKRSMWAGYRP